MYGQRRRESRAVHDPGAPGERAGIRTKHRKFLQQRAVFEQSDQEKRGLVSPDPLGDAGEIEIREFLQTVALQLLARRGKSVRVLRKRGDEIDFFGKSVAEERAGDIPAFFHGFRQLRRPVNFGERLQMLQREMRSGVRELAAQFGGGALQRLCRGEQMILEHRTPLQGIDQLKSPQRIRIDALTGLDKIGEFLPGVDALLVRLREHIDFDGDLRQLRRIAAIQQTDEAVIRGETIGVLMMKRFHMSVQIAAKRGQCAGGAVSAVCRASENCARTSDLPDLLECSSRQNGFSPI